MSGRVSFINTRARIQRLSDAKLFNGWVHQLTPESATISLKSEQELHPGDQVHCEVQGKRLTGVFNGVLSVQKGEMCHFEFTSPFKTHVSVEDVRFKIRGLTGTVYRSAEQPEDPNVRPAEGVFCRIVDVSLEGVGIESESQLAQGEFVILRLESCYGELRCKAEVRYCKKSGDSFRCGLHLEGMDRLSKGIYLRMLESLGY